MTTKASKAPPRDRLLSPDEVADWLGVSPRQVRRYLDERRIEFVHLPRGRRVRESVLRDWVDSHTVPAEED